MSQRTPNANHEKWLEVTQGLHVIRKVIVPMLLNRRTFSLFKRQSAFSSGAL